MAAAIAAETGREKVTGVLVPTHLLDLDPGWLDVDGQLTSRLRRHLDENGLGSTVVYYPVVASLRVLNDPVRRRAILAQLRDLIRQRDIDGVFLRVQGFGTAQAGPVNIRRYLSAARCFRQLNVPLVGERTGTVGVVLAAFGAIGGVESSITYGESYDARRLLKVPKGRGFVPPPRVYLKAALAMVSVAEARDLAGRRGLRRLDCQQPCCVHRRQATLDDPRHHFVVSRAGELSRLSMVAAADRPEQFFTTSLVPARDNTAQLARSHPRFAALAPTGRRLARGA